MTVLLRSGPFAHVAFIRSAIAEGGEQRILHPLSECFVVEGIVVIDKCGKFRNSMQKLLHYLGGQRGEFSAQDAGPLAAGAGPDAVQKFAHRFLVRAGVRPVRGGATSPPRLPLSSTTLLAKRVAALVLPPGEIRPHTVPGFCLVFAAGDA
ncbi:hypothetical protein ACFWUQ_06425 [Streptomyces sp. NPDC058662]|uniref:hypothetical protein n=1 Tax=Streptomyces sp. NPDC058662 TaxID=3346583 RepID=UPI00366150BD